MTALSTPWPYPALIAHRGGGRLAPENTLAAIRTGAAHGYRMMEYDVKLSADGVPILLHDDTVDRTSSGRGAAASLAWRTLAELDFGAWHGPAFAGEPLATLYAAARYTLANGLCSNIEIKPCPGEDTRTGARVATLAAGLWQGANPPPLLSSFSELALQAARVAAPRLPRALLIAGPVPADWHDRARGLDCIGLHIDQRHAQRDAVADILGRGFALAAWTVNDAARARELFAWGCHALFTDELDTLKSIAPSAQS
uniref:glycerophosphodiester phosphodiesterase n=1 Tax=Castellaniella defragrans TaxID=75697 RepID=UPI0033415A9A